MLNCFSSSHPEAIPIVSVDKSGLPSWLESNPAARDWLATVGFEAEPGTHAFVPGANGRPACVLACPNDGPDVWAHAGLSMALPEGTYRMATDPGAAATDWALGWALGSYQFTRYSKAKREPARLVWPRGADQAEVERLGAAIFLARDLINTPAEDMGPAQLAAHAQSLAAAHDAQCDVIEGDALLENNYPTIHVVGRASTRAPRLIDLRWGDPGATKVTLVGKGVCFDSGGLDIKSHDNMLEMKKDMGGAAVVLGLASALMSARLSIRLRVLVPAVDNAIAGNAMRPRDIVRTRAGKTVEVGNTDAEGRLILCDALAEADVEAPELLIDCATLTGAAKIALGTELQALFCDDDQVASALLDASVAAGDPLWRLPIWRPYRKLFDSPCADMNNVAKGTFGGAIIAALYLAQFVSAAKSWAHVDMFAANQSARPGRPEGGEATGLRALYTYLEGRYR